LNVERYPEVLENALTFVEARFERARRFPPVRRNFFLYTWDALDDWVTKVHRRQVESYLPLDGAPPLQSREETIAMTTQLAPFLLIDGAWLQFVSNAVSSHRSLVGKLFNIYADEVGHGDCAANHPNLFRTLLESMGVSLPEVGSRAFCDWPGFGDLTFRFPAYVLAISQFPHRFLPELIGLNLAIELSGVGGSYREELDRLQYYGFDPRIAQIHNAVDNPAAGHTAWSREVVRQYLDDCLETGGPSRVQAEWERIWLGYHTLSPFPPTLGELKGSVRRRARRLRQAARKLPGFASNRIDGPRGAG